MRKMCVMALAPRKGMRDSLESWPVAAVGYSSWGIVIRDDGNECKIGVTGFLEGHRRCLLAVAAVVVLCCVRRHVNAACALIREAARVLWSALSALLAPVTALSNALINSLN